MDVSFSLFLPNTTQITLNERFSNLETTCQKVDDFARFIRVVPRAAAERFEASKNQRLALQMANRMRIQDDGRTSLDTMRDDHVAEVAIRPPRKSVAQRLSYVPARVTARRPSAKSRLTLPAAVAAGRQCTTAADGAISGLWTRRLRARKKGAVSASLASSQVFWGLNKGRGRFPNRTGFSAVSKPASSLATNVVTQSAVAGFETVIGRGRRLEANSGVVSAPAQPAQQKPSGNRSSLRPGKGRAPSSAARGRRKGQGRRKGRGIVKVATDAAALDHELDEYMSHAKLALA